MIRETVSALNHANICTVYDIDQHSGQHFIAMELLQGQMLADRIRRGAIDIGELLNIEVEVAHALESAHAKGIVHHDLKPANLFINQRRHTKIFDFGLVKIERAATDSGLEAETIAQRNDLTVAGTAMGTMSYMSPEQARGQVTDARTDLFSLGTVLYQNGDGTLPFQGNTAAVVTSRSSKGI